MSIFPCINTAEISSSCQEYDDQNQNNESAKHWLKNASFSADLVDCQPPEGTTLSDAASESVPDDDKDRHVHTHGERTTHKYENDSYKSNKRKHKKQHKKRSSSKSRKKAMEKEGRVKDKTPAVTVLPPPRTTFLEEMRNLGYADAYRLDRKGDRDNYTYGSMNKKHLSKYRAKWKVPCGLTYKQSLLWREGQKAKVHLERYHCKAVREAMYKPGVAIKKKSSSEVLDECHISLPPTTSECESAHNPLGILDEATLLWSQGKAPAQADCEESAPSSYLSSAVAQKIATYNRELRERPDDISLWMRLVNVQDALLEQRTDDDSSKLFTQQLINDKKLSIIGQAIKLNPSNLQLKLKELELKGKTMDWADMNKQWKSLTFSHVNDTQVWKGYLQHVKSSFTKFTVSVMVKAYTLCIKSLRQVSEGLLKSHTCLPDTVEYMIDTLLDLCQLLHLANCTEKAVAIAQAMIEFNLYRPSSLGSHEASIQSFQEYYDSGVPRFGEPGAKGWCNVDRSSYTVIPAPLKPTIAQDEEEEERLLAQCQSLSRAESWLLLEKSRQMSHWLPWRPSANENVEDCEDPHRLVLSDDFIDLLFYVGDERLRPKLFLQLITWLGLGSDHTGFNKGPLISGINQLDQLTSINGCHTPSWRDYLLTNLFIAHCTEQMMSQLTGQDKCLLLVQRLYYQLEEVLAATDRKERKFKSKEFRSYAKSVLSLTENRSNEKLWLTLADCYSRLGLYKDMHQIYMALMDSETYHTASVTLTSARCQLWWASTQATISQATISQNAISQATISQNAISQAKPCTEQLLSLCRWLICGGPSSPTLSASQKLLLVRDLEATLQTLCETLSCTPADKMSTSTVLAHVLSCYYVVLLLLKDLSSFQQAICSWTSQFVDMLGADKETLSSYYNKVVQILKYSQQEIYQSCTPLLRSFLQRALGDFPECTALLINYLLVEQSSHVVTRVRQFFTSLLAVDGEKEADNQEVLAIYSVLFELAQLQKLSCTDGSNKGINNRIRSLCVKCLTTVCPNSVLLWRLYMYHEAIYGSKQKLEAIFYAAVQACPYAKALYTDAISYLPHLLTNILGIAEEKELRIHTPLDELDILLYKQ